MGAANISKIDLVRRFIEAWEARSVDSILDKMTPTAIYTNTGLPDACGHDQIRRMISTYLSEARRVRFAVRHIAETPQGAVLTERIDEFQLDDKLLVIPVMGVFEFEGDLICAWREYFDPGVIGGA